MKKKTIKPANNNSIDNAFEDTEVNWWVVGPILIVLAAFMIYAFI